MNVYSSILRRRSIRRFKNKAIPFIFLRQMINAARLAPSAANLQPCEYIIVDRAAQRQKIFPALRWAGYIAPRGNPPKDKQPAAYIVCLINQRIKSAWAEADLAAAIENILLVAQDCGLAGCWLGAIDRNKIARILKVPKYCQVRYVIALGYPDEKPKTERFSGSVKYWQDRRGRLHVPKRSLQDILHRNRY